MTHEPLLPDPQWVYTPGAGYHSRHQGGASIQSPADYAEGFEAGAYALADKLNRIWNGEITQIELFAILAPYRKGQAHPARGWEHEPKRN